MTLRIIAVLMCVAAVASADGPLRPGERVVKRFTRDDLAVTVPKSDNAKFTDNASCEPLYDGTTEAAFVVGFLRNSMFGGGDVSKEPGRVHLLTIEHPPLNGDKCVVIGRLNGDAHREGFQGQHGSVDLSQIRLELSAEVDGKAVTAVFKPNVGSDGGNIPQQTFRLELSKSEGAGPTAVSLDLILPPNGRVSFDEIDLVGLGETATAVIPPAAEVPAGLEPTVIWNHLNEDNGLDGSTNRGPYIGPIYFERRNIDGLGEGNVVVVRPSVDGDGRGG